MARSTALKVRQVYPAASPQASITGGETTGSLTTRFEKVSDDPQGETDGDNLDLLHRLATVGGDLSEILGDAVVDRIGIEAVREWEIDNASRTRWIDVTERGLALAAQERDDQEDGQKEYPFAGASDIHYPILTTAVTQFNARATPELIKGDKVVGVKTFNPPAKRPGPQEVAQDSPPPPNPVAAQQAQMQLQGAEQQEAQTDLIAKAKSARAERIAHYMNFLIFYRMDNWEGETDLLLMEAPVSGAGFKKVYMGPNGLCSDYVSALRLTVHNDTKSLQRCPRITQDFDIYPYEIDQGKRSGLYRDIDISQMGEDPEEPRQWIEQHRMEDLDEDGLPEPYIVTVDVETKRTMRIEAAFTPDDIVINPQTGRVIRIERWVPFPSFMFLPDPRGKFYGMGLAKLLDAITDSVDTSINQMIDATNAQVAGGGFIGANVRLQGQGQGGAVYKQPGEWQPVSTGGADIRQAMYEFTLPQASPVTMTLLELLLDAAKDIASVKDVITGDAPSTAPVGTTLALQNQALQVFSSIYKRMYRGFRDEFRLMFHCLKRWGTDKDRKEYAELTGGDFDQDFQGDGTDIQPVADPSVVTKMQKISRIQTLIQMAESPVGMAAGMTQPGPAQAIMGEALDVLDWDRPERFLTQVPPNPELIAKTKDLMASAALKAAQAEHMGSETTLTNASATEKQANTVKTMGEVGEHTHRIHQEGHRVATEGILRPAPETGPDEPQEQAPAPLDA